MDPIEELRWAFHSVEHEHGRPIVTPISDSASNPKVVFLTGVTGYVGRMCFMVLLEDYAVGSSLREIQVLIRGRKGKGAQQRFEELLKHPPFELFEGRIRNVTDADEYNVGEVAYSLALGSKELRITIVTGSLGKLLTAHDDGNDDSDLMLHQLRRTTVIINAAADVAFDTTIQQATKENVYSVKNLLECLTAAKSSTNTPVHWVQISTCFVNQHLPWASERNAQIPHDTRPLLDRLLDREFAARPELAETVRQLREIQKQSQNFQPQPDTNGVFRWPSTYYLPKSVIDGLIIDCQRNSPTASILSKLMLTGYRASKCIGEEFLRTNLITLNHNETGGKLETRLTMVRLSMVTECANRPFCGYMFGLGASAFLKFALFHGTFPEASSVLYGNYLDKGDSVSFVGSDGHYAGESDSGATPTPVTGASGNNFKPASCCGNNSYQPIPPMFLDEGPGDICAEQICSLAMGTAPEALEPRCFNVSMPSNLWEQVPTLESANRNLSNGHGKVFNATLEPVLKCLSGSLLGRAREHVLRKQSVRAQLRLAQMFGSKVGLKTVDVLTFFATHKLRFQPLDEELSCPKSKAEMFARFINATNARLKQADVDWAGSSARDCKLWLPYGAPLPLCDSAESSKPHKENSSVSKVGSTAHKGTSSRSMFSSSVRKERSAVSRMGSITRAQSTIVSAYTDGFNEEGDS